MRFGLAIAAALAAAMSTAAMAAEDMASGDMAKDSGQDTDKPGAAGYDQAPATRFYVEPRLGAVFLPDEALADGIQQEVAFETGFTGGVSAGYRVFHNLRLEAEIAVDNNNVDSPRSRGGSAGELFALGGFVNAAYDIPTGTAFEPFIGLGVGGVHLDADYNALNLDDTDSRAAYQTRIGVSWNLTRQTGVVLGYRYRATFTDPEYDSANGNVEGEYDNHSVELGLRYRF